MSILKIEYIRGGALTKGTKELSVEVDGCHVGDISDGKILSLELTDGCHDVVVRSGRCMKSIELHLSRDDSFKVTWDWVLGGLLVCDKVDNSFVTGKRRYYWFYVLLLVIMMSYIISMGLNQVRYIPIELFIAIVVSGLVVMAVMVVMVILIRRRKVVRAS